ncbi:putative metallophosphoesterase At3g03305 [Nymphaea colorata]|nr:putative metallophosphoesterase At3g03305 [Nymphaea colorata]
MGSPKLVSLQGRDVGVACRCRTSRMQAFFLIVSLFLHLLAAQSDVLSERQSVGGTPNSRSVVEVRGDPSGVVWVVQLSDLHFSVHHPERAADFSRIVGPALASINPSLVLITGDLTDGKSKDLLTMKQDEREWVEYDKVMNEVITNSGLPREIFYDLRGNHDNFGVPILGGKYDFFNKYSISAGLNRSAKVQSVTLQSSGWKHLFVGIDSTMDVGIRGPTNVFGHPTDQLLADIEAELSQWDAKSTNSVNKIAFGHFPLSFLAATESKKTLKDIFLKHSLLVYLCGHLHTKFGKNLKRNHRQADVLDKYFQFNGQRQTPEDLVDGNCSSKSVKAKEFWEWEMGDWRKNRMMRILAIDQGHISFVDIDYKFEAKKTIVLPTFPLDSRSMQKISMFHDYNCQTIDISSYETIRALVFSEVDIVMVVVKIYDSRSGELNLIMAEKMKKVTNMKSRGSLYTIPWNWKAFADPSPVRYWLQIEAIDSLGSSSFSQLKPFSINGRAAKLSWKWKEFWVMGCSHDSLYYPLFWSITGFLLALLLFPRVLSTCAKENHKSQVFERTFSVGKILRCLVNYALCILLELSRIISLWLALLIYLVYLIYFPWFRGRAFSDDSISGYMSRTGWTVKIPGTTTKQSYIGVPDVVAIVLPHLCFVLLPTVLVASALAAEKVAYHVHSLSLYGKKNEDDKSDQTSHHSNHHVGQGTSKMPQLGLLDKNTTFCSFFCYARRRWIRKILLAVCCIILWWHHKYCNVIIKAYDSNPFLDAAIYCWSVPLLLAFAVYRTSGV